MKPYLSSPERIHFAPLPPATSGRAHKPQPTYREIAEILKTRPGEWARIRTITQTNRAWELNNGRRGFTLGYYEATTRKREDGALDLWARYIGPVETDTAQALTRIEKELDKLKAKLHAQDLAHATNTPTSQEGINE